MIFRASAKQFFIVAPLRIYPENQKTLKPGKRAIRNLKMKRGEDTVGCKKGYHVIPLALSRSKNVFTFLVSEDVTRIYTEFFRQ